MRDYSFLTHHIKPMEGPWLMAQPLIFLLRMKVFSKKSLDSLCCMLGKRWVLHQMPMVVLRWLAVQQQRK